MPNRRQAIIWTNADPICSRIYMRYKGEMTCADRPTSPRWLLTDWIYCLTTTIPGLILGLRPTNEWRRYKVTPSPIGWAQTWNQPWLHLVNCVYGGKYIGGEWIPPTKGQYVGKKFHLMIKSSWKYFSASRAGPTPGRNLVIAVLGHQEQQQCLQSYIYFCQKVRGYRSFRITYTDQKTASFDFEL